MYTPGKSLWHAHTSEFADDVTSHVHVPVPRPSLIGWCGAILAVSTLFFLAVTGQFFGQAPDLDAMVNFREAIIVHKEGFLSMVRARGGTSHPPLLYVLHDAYFSAFGVRPVAMHLLGVSLWAAIVAGTFCALFPYGVWPAFVATLLAVANPLVTVNAFYAMSEALILATFLPALACVVHRRYGWAGFFLGLMVLAKQTSVLFVAVLAAAAALRVMRETRAWMSGRAPFLATALPPFAVFVGWNAALKAMGFGNWRSEIQGGTSLENPYLIALTSPWREGFFSIHFKQNFANAFLVHWNWIAGVATACALVLLLIGPASRRRLGEHGWIVWTCMATAVAYIVFVFPFPTWTIPRYALPPLFLCMMFAFAAWARLVSARIFAPIAALVLAAFATDNLASVDPVSKAVFGMAQQRGEEIFNTDYAWRGPDRAMANLQFAAMSVRQNRILSQILASDADAVVGDCHDLKIGEKLWTVGAAPDVYAQFPSIRQVTCVHAFGEDAGKHVAKLQGRKVFTLAPEVFGALARSAGVTPAALYALDARQAGLQAEP